ncbi:MAG TPA: universal stress protein [Rhizobiaceae bacterium]|nr:universal stress protein [Rhizobiaceae bacterium]
MAETNRADQLPKKILLGTDLSARSDRALDRAVLLAAAWKSELFVLHVLEEEQTFTGGNGPIPSWRRPPDPQSLAERRLRADLHGLDAQATVIVEQGAPGEVMLRVAEEQGCDLILTGLARDELLGRFSLGATVDRLLRQSAIPLLIVKDRARSPYLNVVVAADFSDSARLALETALNFFPDRQLTVFHAYDAPMAGFAGDPEAYRRDYGSVAEREYKEFLRTVRIPEGRQAPPSLIEWGEPARLLRELADYRHVDLVVLGTHGRGPLFEAIIGGTARQILAQLPCDALVVPRKAG